MKKNIIILALLVFALKLNAQINVVEQTEYTKDSIPILIMFKYDIAKYKKTDAIAVIKQHLKLTNNDDLKIKKTFTDDLGFTHERYQHYFKGIKVEFSEYTAHSKDNMIQSISGKLKTIESINVNPSLTQNEALSLTLKYVNSEVYMWEIEEMENYLKSETNDNSSTYYPKGELVIWTDWEYEKTVLAYKFDVYSQSPFSHNYYYIDAHSGNIIDVQQILKNDAVLGTAATRYSGNRNLTTDSFSGGFRLHDPSRGNGIETMDLNQSTIISSAIDFVDNDNNWSAAEWDNIQLDNAAFDAHHAAQRTYDYFRQPFINRNGWDNSNTLLRLYVHFNNNWNNAGWDSYSNHIILGDGNGVVFNPLTDLDVIAHEFGHGISVDEIGLNTNGEPGAIDEGLSDIWAACVEQFAAIPGNNIWIMGEDYQIDANERRNMQNPGASHYHELFSTNPPIPYPDTYMGMGWYTGTWDYGGRHLNCMVFSHWFFLLSQGGTGTNDIDNCFSINGIGINNAARIVYRMETVYLTANSTFSDARSYAIQSARDLFGVFSNEVIQTTNSWYAVGVGNALNGIITGSNIVCASNATFYLMNALPAGTTVSWSPSSNLRYVSGQGTNNYTVKASSTIVSGLGSVTATINGPCGSLLVDPKVVWVGKPNYYIVSDSFFEPLAPGIAIIESEVADPYSFQLVNRLDWSYTGPLTNFIGDLYKAKFRAGSQPGQGFIYSNAFNVCGYKESQFYYQVIGTFKVLLSPNPASDQISVVVIDSAVENNTTEPKYFVSILNSFGNVEYKQLHNGRAFTLNISQIPKGIHAITIEGDGKICSANFLKE